MLKPVPPAMSNISLKNEDRFIATIGPSKTNEYHSALDALNNFLE
jgi:hypothetical protein